MKIVFDFPPNYPAIVERFGDGVTPRAIFAWGDTIYSPGNVNVSADLMAHEETHSRQQGGQPSEWWARYLTDVDFLVDQEAEAYARQYESLIVTKRRNRNQDFKVLLNLASILAGPLYGRPVSVDVALAKISAKVKPQH